MKAKNILAILISSITFAKNKRQSEVYAGYNRRVLKLNGYYS